MIRATVPWLNFVAVVRWAVLSLMNRGLPLSAHSCSRHPPSLGAGSAFGRMFRTKQRVVGRLRCVPKGWHRSPNPLNPRRLKGHRVARRFRVIVYMPLGRTKQQDPGWVEDATP